MSKSARYLADSFAAGAKRAAKRVYRGPVIRAAGLYRPMLRDATFVGITGSSGKTTTKDLAHLVLSRQFRAHRNTDTNNSLYSVAHTLLRSPRGMQICIQEIGAWQGDDLSNSARLLKPSIGVVTNIGREHYKVGRAAEEKVKLIRALPASGVAVLNADDDLVFAMSSSAACRVISYGRKEGCDLRAVSVRGNWPDRLELTLEHQGDRVVCKTQLCGEHLAYCVLAAVAIGLACGMTLRSAAAPVIDFLPVAGRMMPVEISPGITILRDDWKAPLWSIDAPLKFLRSARAKRKIAVLGTLSDYSGKSRKAYVRVSRLALEAADHVIFVGPNSHRALRGDPVPPGKSLAAFVTVKDLAEHLRAFLVPGDLVLLKASGSDHLARLALMYQRDVRCWRERCGRNGACDNCGLLCVPQEKDI